jgi:hypothetical protein
MAEAGTFRHLPDEQLRQIHRAALALSLAQSQDALLNGLSPVFVASLEVRGRPDAQLLDTLFALNTTESLEDGSVPLQIWLSNAIRLSEEKPGVEVFARALATIGGSVPLAPLVAPAKPPPWRRRRVRRGVLLGVVAALIAFVAYRAFTAPVPDVEGLSLDVGRKLAVCRGLYLDVVSADPGPGSGPLQIVEQIPSAGSRAWRSSHLRVKVIRRNVDAAPVDLEPRIAGRWRWRNAFPEWQYYVVEATNELSPYYLPRPEGSTAPLLHPARMRGVATSGWVPGFDLDVSATWRVENGYLVYTILTSNSVFVRAGDTWRTRVLWVDETELATRNEELGITYIDRRE